MCLLGMSKHSASVGRFPGSRRTLPVSQRPLAALYAWDSSYYFGGRVESLWCSSPVRVRPANMIHRWPVYSPPLQPFAWMRG